MDSSTPRQETGLSIIQKIQFFFLNHWRDLLYLLVFAGIIVAADQWTKSWVRSNLSVGEDWLPEGLAWLAPYARLRLVQNSGAAFGLFQKGGWIFAVLAVVVSIMIITYFPSVSKRDWWLRVSLGLELGGALGNLFDRIRFGPVTDFISVGSFAIFNVADSCITIGVTILILGVWIMERKQKKEKSPEVEGD